MEVGRTERALESMTDEGLFEKLAAAVLRDAAPIYRSLAHPGVNADGKTIKSRVDGITFVPEAKPPHMVIVHHTTTAQRDLGDKWLHDPSTVTSSGSRRASPPGDLIKAAAVAAEHRRIQPGVTTTLVLTTNREPDETTIRAVHAAAAQAEIKVDLWSRSRLAHFLDHNPQGQWLRRQYLGDPPERVSIALMHELSTRSIAAFNTSESPRFWIERALDQTLASYRHLGATFLVAPSGVGKSTACFKLLAAHVAAGGAGLILPDAAIAGAVALDSAIEDTLRELEPSLARGSGSDALALSTPENPLLLIVEDINRSGQAATLAEKILGWHRRGGDADTVQRAYRLICPIWPDVLGILQDRARTIVMERAIFAGPFEPEEGCRAVQRRAREAHMTLSNIDAASISEALGHDPLLIGLHDPAKPIGSASVIGAFVESCIFKFAAVRGRPAAKYRIAIRNYAAAALRHRGLNPQWSVLEQWPDVSDSERELVGEIAQAGEVLQLVGSSVCQRMGYRHDRVRDWLLIDAAADLLQRDLLQDEIIKEPFFAEVIAGVVASGSPTDTFLSKMRAQCPLALFHALKLLPANSPMRGKVEWEIDRWLSDPESASPSNLHLRSEALSALAQTDGAEVARLAQKIDDRSGFGWVARLRNGDTMGAVELCYRAGPSVTAAWRDDHLEHAKQKFGSDFSCSIDQLLRQPSLATRTRVGLLRLAGHMADQSLGQGILTCWKNDAVRNAHLSDYLWACARCAGNDPEALLEPVCDTWAALPLNADDNKRSPRAEVASNYLRPAFRGQVPRSAIPYFIKRAEQEDLRWPIILSLEEADDPVAISFIVKESAAIRRENEGTTSFSHFTSTLTWNWRRRYEDGWAEPMSAPTRAVLLTLWADPQTEKHVRQQAFRLWSATRTDADLPILRGPSLPQDIRDEILRQRLERADRTAVPALLEKLSERGELLYWWLEHVKYIWSDDLLPILENELAARAASIEPKWHYGRHIDDALSDLLMRALPNDAEKLLVKHWSALRHINFFIHAALYVGTPVLRQLAHDAITESADSKMMLEHICMHFGIKVGGRRGITRPAQIASLSPYLIHLSRHDVMELWHSCNEHGWYDLRRSLLDPYLRRIVDLEYEDELATFSALDKMVNDHVLRFILWLEDYSKAGVSHAAQIAVISKWLGERKTISAMKLAGEALKQIGRRSDLALLDLPVDGADAELQTIRANITFAVQRRTLE
jgi:hypothetical protein